jgi:hypothetical protein
MMRLGVDSLTIARIIMLFKLLPVGQEWLEQAAILDAHVDYELP